MRSPQLGTEVEDQFMDEIVAVPIIQFKCSVVYRHVFPIEYFIATGSQADTWTLGWFDIKIPE